MQRSGRHPAGSRGAVGAARLPREAPAPLRARPGPPRCPPAAPPPPPPRDPRAGRLLPPGSSGGFLPPPRPVVPRLLGRVAPPVPLTWRRSQPAAPGRTERRPGEPNRAGANRRHRSGPARAVRSRSGARRTEQCRARPGPAATSRAARGGSGAGTGAQPRVPARRRRGTLQSPARAGPVPAGNPSPARPDWKSPAGCAAGPGRGGCHSP